MLVAVLMLATLPNPPDRGISHIQISEPPLSYAVGTHMTCRSGLRIRINGYGLSLQPETGPHIYVNDLLVDASISSGIMRSLDDDDSAHRIRVLCDRAHPRAAVSIYTARPENDTHTYWVSYIIMNANGVEDQSGPFPTNSQSFWMW